MSDKDTLPVWKKIYQIVSLGNENVTKDVVEEVLEICQEKLSDVLLGFKLYSKESFDQWKKVSESMLISKDDEMCSFIHRMSRELDLDVNIAWSIICNFLIFDYYGKVDELKSIIRYEANVKSLIDHVWYFYSADRMFLLKTLRYIFENLTEKDHIFFEQFNIFIESLDINQLWKSLLKTFELLLSEIDKDKSNRVTTDTLTRWVQRNNREQVEVLQLMLHVVDLMPLNGEELIELLKLFMRHGFGRHPLFFGADMISRTQDVSDIKNAEIGVILTLVHRYWQNSKLCKVLPKQLEGDLEQYQIQGNNSAILFIWVVLKSSLVEDSLDYCNNALEALIAKNIFKCLNEFITSNIYQNCKAGEIVIEGMNRLFIEFTKMCAEYRYIFEQDGVVPIICELLKRPYLGALDNFGKFFEIALDMFPFYLDNFLSMCEALIMSKEYYDKVLKLLHNFPSYTTELPWTHVSDAIRVDESQNLFLGTDKFIIPLNTLAERCTCYGQDVVKFHYKYDYFLVIEQYMRSLTMWAVNRGGYNKWVLECTLRGYKFLSFLVQHYKGDFSKDDIIKPLLHRLDCVPTYYSKGGFRNFDLFYIFFEAKSGLLRYRNADINEAFPLVVRKTLFLEIADYNTCLQELRDMHTSEELILYSYLREEEALKDHKLLIQYLEFVLDITKKNILHKEILYSCTWYLLNIVFSNHKQWNYDEGEPFQQTKVLNLCLQVFCQILQQDPENIKNEHELHLFTLVQNSFFKSDSIVNSLCSVFIKDKFYLQNLMHQESNWISGSTLIVIETVRLELVLLLLIYKCRGRYRKEKFLIDDKIHVFAKYASGYFINSYNCTLAVLACKFLKILAQDDNVPLMSCLSLDHQQVQTLFLDRLRDPMEDEEVKLMILDLISTCIFHQTGLTAAFFNIQSTKKWYTTETTQLEIDTVGDFMVDYLQNIKKSVAFLKSPLQVGVLRVMSNLWECQKQHLIKDVTSLTTFWPLLLDPFFKPFDQTPLVYSYILKIVSIHFMLVLRKNEEDTLFFKSLQKFLTDQKQLRLWQQYLIKILSEKQTNLQDVKEIETLIQCWAELLVITDKQKKVFNFPNSECQYLYIELCLDGFKLDFVHDHILSTWLDFTLVVLDMFGLEEFEQRYEDLTVKAVELTKIVKYYYEIISTKDRKTFMTIVLKIMRELKIFYESWGKGLGELLDTVGYLVDFEHRLMEERLWKQLKEGDPAAKELLGIWAIIISIANFVLTLDNCSDFTLWFTMRKYLNKMVKCTCDLLSHKEALRVGKMAMYSLILYVNSPLAYDFLKVNMLEFFDKVEPMVNMLLTGQLNKVNVLDLKEAWIIFNLLVKLVQSFVRKFQKSSLEIAYAFFTINDHIIKHIMSLPENTVDFVALDLLTQTLILYNDVLEQWKVEWYRKSNKTFTFMIDGISKVVNSCIYLCLRPKHIGFYFLDIYYRLVPIEQDAVATNDMMIAVINRLIGILGLSFSALYKLNISLIECLDYFEPQESIIVLVQNDFSVPRFELPIPCDLNYGKLLCLAHFLCKTMNQLNQAKQSKAQKIDENKYKFYIGLVEHQDPSEYMPNQKLSSFLRYLYEYSGLIDPWINNLNYKNVQKTADMLMLFIAQQAFLTIKILEPNQVPYYKRNLYSELQFFNEYVKKRTSELIEYPGLKAAAEGGTYKGDTDIVKRYLLHNWKHKRTGEVADKNFLLIVYFWFSNICQVQ